MIVLAALKGTLPKFKSSNVDLETVRYHCRRVPLNAAINPTHSPEWVSPMPYGRKLGAKTMGYYINPPDMTKEQFLEKYGQPLANPADFDFAGANLPVCLVDNTAYGFTAAGICYDARERDVFISPDSRPKKWFTVSRELLKPYYNR